MIAITLTADHVHIRWTRGPKASRAKLVLNLGTHLGGKARPGLLSCRAVEPHVAAIGREADGPQGR